MHKRIVYISLTFLTFTILIGGFLLCQLNSEKKNPEASVIDIVEDPLADYSEGRKQFKINCAACHRIGGRSTPDLLVDLRSKMNKSYFHLFVTKQDSLVISGDKYQTEIASYNDFSHVAIAHTFNLDREKTDKLYDFIIAAKSR